GRVARNDRETDSGQAEYVPAVCNGGYMNLRDLNAALKWSPGVNHFKMLFMERMSQICDFQPKKKLV
ncbi:MAG: hypothetical protein QHC81_29770, partial [Achromobacter sp.]|nr:hypothetical protein [Achromobacter sp.]